MTSYSSKLCKIVPLFSESKEAAKLLQEVPKYKSLINMQLCIIWQLIKKVEIFIC